MILRNANAGGLEVYDIKQRFAYVGEARPTVAVVFIGNAFYPKRARSRGAPSSRDQVVPLSRPLQSSLHLAMAARLCVHALADRKALAPQDLAALLITLDLVSHSAGRLLFSSRGQLSAVTQGLDVARGIGHRRRSRRVARDRLDTTARVKLNR